jgi:ribosome-associated protein
MQDDEDQQELKPSKTQVKKRMLELQALGERLVELNAKQLESIELPEQLHDAITEAREMTKHEARRRQLQYIGRLMRDVDPAPIQERISVWDGQSLDHSARLHRVERWRDRLLEDDGAFAEIMTEYRNLDTQRLRALIRSARQEYQLGKPRRHYRELFKFLRETLG